MIPILTLSAVFIAVALWLLKVAARKHRDCQELAAKNRVLNAALAAKSRQIAETADVLNECRDVIVAVTGSEARRLAASRRLREISLATDGFRADLIRRCKRLTEENTSMAAELQRIKDWQQCVAHVADWDDKPFPSAVPLNDITDSNTPEEG
jgi:hypothetical protein